MSTDSTDQVVGDETAEEAIDDVSSEEMTQEPEIEAPSSETQSTGEDAGWQDYATQQGFTPDDLQFFGITDQAGVDSVIEWQVRQQMLAMQQQQPQYQQPQQPHQAQEQPATQDEATPPWEYQQFEGQLPEDLYDESLSQFNKDFEGHLQGQLGELNSMWQSRYDQIAQGYDQVVGFLQSQWEQQQQAANQQALQQFEEAIERLGPEFEPLLGKGSITQMPDGIVKTNRIRAIEAYELAQRSAGQMGRNMTPDQLLRAGLSSLFPSELEKIQSQQATSQARRRQRQAIGRPNQTNESDTPKEERAKRKVRQILDQVAARGDE